MTNFETVKSNTLKMIRNNKRYEDLFEKLIYYAREKGNYELLEMIEECLKTIEFYEE